MGSLPLNLITFPLWWYTVGLGLVWHFVEKKFRFWLHASRLKLFVKHLQEPLFGDYTKGGRFISFFLRIFLFIFKGLFLLVKMLVLLLLVMCYCALLPGVLVMIIYELFPV